MSKKIKIVTVGDGAVGKTCILVTYSTDVFPTKYVPTVFDNYEDEIFLEGKKYTLELWDTAGQEDYDNLRPSCYKNCDVFIICYSIVHSDSLEHVKLKWIPEIQKHCPGVPFILVGTKSDLRGGSHDCIDTDVGKKLAEDICAADFLECSAMTQNRLKEVMITAATVAITKGQAKKKCTIM